MRRKINEVTLKTYKLKTVDQTKDKTINICNRTALGRLLRSFLVSSNIMFALSIIQFLIPFIHLVLHKSVITYDHCFIVYCTPSRIGNMWIIIKHRSMISLQLVQAFLLLLLGSTGFLPALLRISNVCFALNLRNSLFQMANVVTTSVFHE